MKNLAFITIIFFFFLNSGFSQDTIVKAGGEKIICNIIKEDNEGLYYATDSNRQNVYNYIKKSEIENFKYRSGKKAKFPELDRVSIGLGFGIDFGCIGTNLTIYPQKNIGVFGCVGYAFAGVGYNIGLKLRSIPDKPSSKVSPFAFTMYGYNTVIIVANDIKLNKFFYGPTIGLGIDYHLRSTGYWSFGLLLPIRSSDVKDYMDDLKKNQNIEFKYGLFPIGISVGYKSVL